MHDLTAYSSSEVKPFALEHVNMMYYSQEIMQLHVPASISGLFYAIIAIVISIVVFLFVFTVNDVAKVKGVIRTGMNNSIIKNVIPGKIEKICYHPEQFVQKGDVLYVLDDEVYRTLREDLTIELQDTQEWLLCLDQMIEGYQSGRNTATDMNSLAHAKLDEYFTNVAYLESQLKIACFQLKTERDQPASIRLDRNVEESSLRVSVAEDELQRYKAGFYSQILEQHKQYGMKYEKLQQELIRTDEQYAFLCIKSPVSGFVQEISSLNEGDYIFADQNVLTIVPNDSENFRIELSVPTKNIGELKEGMTVKYRLSAFPFFEYKGAEGVITSIDPDIRQGESGALSYCVYADIDRTVFRNYRGSEYPLRAGIEVDARIVLEKTKIAFYLLRKMDFLAR